MATSVRAKVPVTKRVVLKLTPEQDRVLQTATAYLPEGESPTATQPTKSRVVQALIEDATARGALAKICGKAK